MHRIALVITIAAAFLAGARPALGQAVNGTLRAEDPDRPIAGARLILLDTDGAPVDSAVTERAGTFRLSASAAGSYTVYFHLDGWAGVPSRALELETGATMEFEFRVPLIANSAIRQMSDVLGMERWLQGSLSEICGEPYRGWEAGLLVGVVRRGSSWEPIGGARVAVLDDSGAEARSSIATESGVYVLCNVPVGDAVGILIELADGTTERTDVEIRPGTASWYDLPVGPRRR
ncbi:MAG TPA: carboxypeptidase-like regulatory domain-containing protein [Longimicrobiales bacterium]|nr:carboxypeptidase-like regulatory domain-containing protein [Longimicrobiales bacterium]